MNLKEILQKTVDLKASDLHITVALPPMMRINSELKPYGENHLTPADTEEAARQVLDDTQMKELEDTGEIDLSYVLPGISRFRVNVYKQRGTYTVAFRVIWINVPTIDELGFPDVFKELALRPRGLVLVTGPTGSGKSTTLAAMVNHINQNRNSHILTLEEPIEYLHRHNKSMINQREVGSDTASFAAGLRAALREDPDVLLVGEMRDLETISTALTAAETGHLVLSTLHTTGAALTIDRIIDVFPPNQQQQIRIQLAGVLEGVISQLLLPTIDGRGMVVALEILLANTAVRNLIREGKTHQITTVIQTNTKNGMKSLDYSLSELVKKGKLSRDEAAGRSSDVEMFRRYLMQTGSL